MISRLTIQTALVNGRTRLGNAYFTRPFKVADITEDKTGHRLELMLMSSSPGVLDNDHYQLRIEMAAGSSLQLHTQSYQRLFNMKSAASQEMEMHLAPSSSICFLPHPTVPHRNADFRSVNKVFLAEECSLVLGEILTCGRKLNGEVFLFSRYHSTTSIYLQNKLVIRENLLIEPAQFDPQGLGQLEGYTHQASLIYVHPRADIAACSSIIRDILSAEPGIDFGISQPVVNGLIIRLLGNGAEQLHQCLQKIAAALPQTVNQQRELHPV